MKTIRLVQMGTPSRQWAGWIEALEDAGFTMCNVTPMALELQSIYAKPGEIVLFDGMLPNLSRFIERTCAQNPEVHVVVATEIDSFTVKYEVLLTNGAIYISAPANSDALVKAIQSIGSVEHEFSV
ncbi:hypothetical protein P4C99_04300 [Pontiellaceae bacterium B1224]|nr:hypothetical protein [Pontiellaceae bacterium B1224]